MFVDDCALQGKLQKYRLIFSVSIWLQKTKKNAHIQRGVDWILANAVGFSFST